MCVCRRCVLSAGTRLCDESVICKVASLKALNSKKVLLWIFNLKRTVNFIYIYFLIWPKTWKPSMFFFSPQWPETRLSPGFCANILVRFELCFQKYIYMCDFVKKGPNKGFRLNTGIALVHSSQCRRKKDHGACRLARRQKRAQAKTYHRWVAFLFCAKTRGLGRGDFVTLIIVLSQKARQSQEIFPVG